VSERIHDDELDTSEEIVRTLLSAQCPQWGELPITYLRTSGTDNAMWRVRVPGSADVVVRLPRRRHAAETLEEELDVLRAISESSLPSIVSTPPRVRRVVCQRAARGQARLACCRPRRGRAGDRHTGGYTGTGSRARRPRGPIAPLVQRLDHWLDDPESGASELIDVAAVRRLSAEALDVSHEPVVSGFVHGDLIPGNLLLETGRLSAIIDWGCAAFADPAQDLAPAWAVLDARNRHIFRQAVGMDDAAWVRGRTFELQHAVGGVLYYSPRRHPLGDVMARTLERILDER
jgi:aminoglycoside phosphotransferase (APT) family kinase protein